jgi:outer membrane receptor protein involved in Fe transport
MTATHVVLALALAATGLAQLVALPRAQAQSSTTGAIQGQISDAASGEHVAGVTVVVSSPVLQGTQTAFSDDNGFYKISELPPGDYLVTFYYNQTTVQRSAVNVGVNKTTPVFQTIAQSHGAGEIVAISDTPPTIDPTSTTQGITLDKNYLRNIPVPGRTFGDALSGAAGSQSDGTGIAFSGSSSIESQYIVDGVNTTSLTFGAIGTPVINEFIEEIEVITGGYNAEYGRSTGGVVNVVTKSGSNEFKGSIFGTFQPGVLTAPVRSTPINAGSIDASSNNAYQADIGFELGGPIILDRLWFFVGFAPQFKRTDITRTTKRQTDCRELLPSGALSNCDARAAARGGFADGVPDIDPRTGFFITDTLDQEVRTDTTSTYNLIGKINYAAAPEHQLQVALQAMPQFATDPGIFGLASSGFKRDQLTTDSSAKWTSKFNDSRTQVEAVVGWHRDTRNVDAIDPSVQNQPLQVLSNGNLGTWGPGFGGETQRTLDGCFDSASSGDPYPLITNCPMLTRAYTVGGPGAITRDVEQRISAAASLTQRVKLLGSHEIKAGIDVESDASDKARLYSGGAFIENFVGQQNIRVTRWVQLRGPSNPDPRFDNTCGVPNGGIGGVGSVSVNPDPIRCDYLGGEPGDPGTQINGSTLNWSGFLRDSWQVLPNLTLNLGVRYEEQRLRYAEYLQHTVDALTEQRLGKNAITLQNLWAPRLGAIYDWTQEGRSKIYAHWGRFYESIPLDINDRSLGGEVQFMQDFQAGACGMADARIGGANGVGCLGTTSPATQNRLIGASGTLIAPGLRPQYLDEIVVGVEYEVLDDLKLGASYQNRRLGRVIEDVSTDGASTYLIANPGEWSSADEKNLIAKIDRTTDPTQKNLLQNELALFRGIRIFDKPRRDYNAIQLTLTRRFSKQLYLQGSYTYARTVGNYPGLISYDNNQTDPNISSQYDLIELLANREGPLPQDRPHSIKLDGYYTFDLGTHRALTVGGRVRAMSGVPENALAAHYLYGPDESFLLPRGTLGRSEFDHGVDLHVEYAWRISQDRHLDLSVYLDVFNLYDSQGSSSIDNTYARPVSLSGALQNAAPISGGSYEDLIWVKQIDQRGNESAAPIGRNPNFHNTATRYAPAYARLGARLTF